MSFQDLSAGPQAPEDLHAVIEIPMNASPIKYEVDKKTEALFVDRFMPTAMFYPMNYGYIPSTLGEDGDPLDILVLTPYPVVPGSVVRSRVVGMLMMEDEAGSDAKILAVAHNKLTPMYDHIQDVDDLDPLLKKQVQHFFEHYKDLEPGKWVKIEKMANKAEAFQVITRSIQQFK